METTKPYSGHQIHLNVNSWEFTVTGPEFDNSEHQIVFHSFQAARNEIYKRVVDSQKIAAQNVKLKGEIKQIEDSLRSVQMDRSRSYSRIEAESYAGLIERLKAEIQKTTATAKEREKPQEITDNSSQTA